MIYKQERRRGDFPSGLSSTDESGIEAHQPNTSVNSMKKRRQRFLDPPPPPSDRYGTRSKDAPPGEVASGTAHKSNTTRTGSEVLNVVNLSNIDN